VSIVIAGSYLGTDQHLLYDGDHYRWISDIPDDSWMFGFDDSRDLREIATAMGFEIGGFESSPHSKAFSKIISGIPIPWIHTMPSDQFQKQLSGLVDQLWMLTNDNYVGYYMKEFVINRETLDSLSTPMIDVDEFDRVCDLYSASHKIQEIKKFKPDSDGFSPKTRYNLAGSITGRLTVSSGPNILTLKKEHRSIFKSRFMGGKIIQVDISSLEPRIALGIAKKQAPDDIYTFVRDSVLSGDVTRNQAKVAVLSCIYGGGAWSLSKRLPDNLDSHSVLSSVKSYFNISKLHNRLKREYHQRGLIKNLYGRPIRSGEALVNHYLQSTGVDVSFDVFRSILSKLNEFNFEHIPVYVIHDAIVLDITSESLRGLREIVQDGIYVESVGSSFPVKIEIIKE